jgi:TatD DNase family protein
MRACVVSRSFLAVSLIHPVRSLQVATFRRARHLRSSCRTFSQQTISRMAPELIDVDCNLWHRDLKTLQNKEIGENDADSPWNILKEDAIAAANVIAMLSPSSTIEEARLGLKLLQTKPPPLTVKTTVGVHPYHVNDDEFSGKSLEEHGATIKSLIRSNLDLCSAVGECGLDASEGFPPLQDQLPWFRLQVEIAEELGVPLFIHERLAFSKCMDILKAVKVPVIIHCFTGTKEQCAEYVKRGYYISLSGYILKETNDNYNDVLACLTDGIIPLDKLMIETDAPYMGFTKCRQLYMEFNGEYVSSLNSKKRKRLQQSIYPNVPSSLPLVLDKVAECLLQYDSTLSREQIAQSCTENSKKFFGF